MNALRTILRRNFGLAFALLAMALLVRAAVPQGWMPQSERGTIKVHLCASGDTIEIPFAGKEAPSRDHERGQQPCAFGSIAHGAAPPPAIAVLPLPEMAAEHYARAHAPFILAQAARQMPPARAPPIPA